MQDRVQFAQIGSLQPLADYRKAGVIGVLEGRNFAWDASGVLSAFGSRLIAGGSSISPFGRLAHEIEVEGNYFVGVWDTVYKLNPASAGSSTGVWEDIATLDLVQTSNPALVPDHFEGFTHGFLGGKGYTCSWNQGVYEINLSTDAFTRLTSDTVSGFPPDSEPVIAITETNGRLCYLTAVGFYWSGPNDPTDLVPALGGAGLQVIAERIGGEPRAMITTSTGAIIWTTSGALVAEFIGGDAVFRFYELASDVLPLSQSATVKLPTNAHLVLTRLGLFSVVQAQTPEVVTPLFNEFLREYMRTRRLEVAHMWYTQADNRLFISFKTQSDTFIETFCLDLALDRWGVFNTLHLGMFNYIDRLSPFAFINGQGIASYFLPARDPRKNRENPAAPGTFTGLGSSIVLGFIRSERIALFADSLQELQTVVVYRKLSLDGFQDTFFDEGAVTAASGADTVDEGLVTDVVIAIVDEGLLLMTLPAGAYRLQILTDIFSADEGFAGNLLCDSMFLANVGALADTWTGRLTSYYFRLKFTAENDGEFFRINAVDCTLTSAGQLI